MTRAVSNRILIGEPGRPPEETLASVIRIITRDEAAIRSAEKGVPGPITAPFDHEVLVPTPDVVAAVPSEPPEHLDIALAAISGKFDLVAGRNAKANAASRGTPGHWEINKRHVIESYAHATKTPEELLAWAEERVPEALRAARLVRAALMGAGHHDRASWSEAKLGAAGFAETARVMAVGDAVMVDIESFGAAPLGWLRELRGRVTEANIVTFSWSEDDDYSAFTTADGDRVIVRQSEEPSEARSTRAAATWLSGSYDREAEEAPAP